jgi:hypothetical protein
MLSLHFVDFKLTLNQPGHGRDNLCFCCFSRFSPIVLVRDQVDQGFEYRPDQTGN